MLLTAPSALSLSHMLTESRQTGEEEDAVKKEWRGEAARGLSLEGADGPGGRKEAQAAQEEGKKILGRGSLFSI